jgi:hypothetical protein
LFINAAMSENNVGPKKQLPSMQHSWLENSWKWQLVQHIQVTVPQSLWYLVDLIIHMSRLPVYFFTIFSIVSLPKCQDKPLL